MIGISGYDIYSTIYNRFLQLLYLCYPITITIIERTSIASYLSHPIVIFSNTEENRYLYIMWILFPLFSYDILILSYLWQVVPKLSANNRYQKFLWCPYGPPSSPCSSLMPLVYKHQKNYSSWNPPTLAVKTCVFFNIVFRDFFTISIVKLLTC